MDETYFTDLREELAAWLAQHEDLMTPLVRERLAALDAALALERASRQSTRRPLHLSLV
jgi:hypothetical protein